MVILKILEIIYKKTIPLQQIYFNVSTLPEKRPTLEYVFGLFRRCLLHSPWRNRHTVRVCFGFPSGDNRKECFWAALCWCISCSTHFLKKEKVVSHLRSCYIQAGLLWKASSCGAASESIWKLQLVPITAPRDWCHVNRTHTRHVHVNGYRLFFGSAGLNFQGFKWA